MTARALPSHGVSGYNNRGCRCVVCVEAQRARVKRYLAKRTPTTLPADDARHGRRSTYINYGCRCVACATANSRYLRGDVPS